MLHLLFFLLFAADHPYHIDNTLIEWNKKDNVIEITNKIFPDDLEWAIQKELNIKTNVDDTNHTIYHTTLSVINTYYQKHFNVLLNNKKIALTVIGFEQKSSQLYVYLTNETPLDINTIENVKILNTLLYNIETEQQHFFNLKIAGLDTNFKTAYPKKYVDIPLRSSFITH